MALQMQGFAAKICGNQLCERRCFKLCKCQFEKLSHSLFMLSCQHTLNVKELVWQSGSQGYSWIIDVLTALLLLFLLSLWLCIACGRSLPQLRFLWRCESTQSLPVFLFIALSFSS